MNIAFIGLGNMGLPMALNLIKAGHQVTGYDINTAACEKLRAHGGHCATSIAEAATAQDAVLTMLPASHLVESCYLGTATDPTSVGILAAAAPSTLLIDSSTIAPESAIKVATAATAKGFQMVDAPVSGGTAGAAAGTLTFMVGGSTEAFAQARPLLEVMGKNIFHAGAHGAGQTVKICNNMLLGILMVGTCEAIQLGVANGLDPVVLSSIMTKCSGRNWSLEVYNPCPGVMENSPASHGYQGGFMTNLMLKDLSLALENAEGLNKKTPLGALVRALYQKHSDNGFGGLDFSSIYERIDQLG